MECSRPASDTLDALELLPGEAAKARATPASGTPGGMPQRRGAAIWAPASTYAMRRDMRAPTNVHCFFQQAANSCSLGEQRAEEASGDRKR